MNDIRNYMVDGTIVYPDETTLTWGPFYFHDKEKAKSKMETILKDITDWCNGQDPSFNISQTNVIRTIGGDQIAFKIQAWRDENTLQDCNCLIQVDEIFFEG